MAGGLERYVAFFDNMPFEYDVRTGRFFSVSPENDAVLTADEARERGMIRMDGIVTTVDGVPFRYDEERDFYRSVGHPVRVLSWEEMNDLVEHASHRIDQPHGAAFRDIMKDALESRRMARREERDY